MDRYEKIAESILAKITENTKAEEITISMEDAVKIYSYLLGLSRVLKIAESEDGGSEYFG